MRSEAHRHLIEHSPKVLTEGDTESDAAASNSHVVDRESRCRTSEVDAAFDTALPQSAGVPTLKEYALLLSGMRCRWCRTRLKRWVEHYDHSGGWAVYGFSQKQWLYTTCPKCKYQWNLGKLGIAR